MYCQIFSIIVTVKLFVNKHFKWIWNAYAAAAEQEHSLRLPGAQSPVMYPFIWHLSASFKG